MIIGITGRKGHGKDTLGAMFMQWGFQRDFFAAPIKEAVKVALNMTDDQVHGTVDIKETVDPRYGITPRWAMQSLGTEWGRTHIHEDVWALACMSRIDSSSYPDWVITDTRFLNEARIIRENEGYLVRIVRPGADNGQFEDHPSEREIGLIDAHVDIISDGTLAQLEAVAKNLYGALRAGVLDLSSPITYRCSEYQV